MAKAKTKKKTQEADGAYFLKLVLYFVIGSQFIRLVDTAQTHQIPLPIGLIIGLFFAAHEHFQIDRKIEYAVLLIATMIGFWFQTGLLVTVLK